MMANVPWNFFSNGIQQAYSFVDFRHSVKTFMAWGFIRIRIPVYSNRIKLLQFGQHLFLINYFCLIFVIFCAVLWVVLESLRENSITLRENSITNSNEKEITKYFFCSIVLTIVQLYFANLHVRSINSISIA